ncbi:MAG: hypothetical protein JNJ57_19100, partial [Saprospiraceae bacterium]|nr:hypothetical protein [Saprospiraceae bacterium]
MKTTTRFVAALFILLSFPLQAQKKLLFRRVELPSGLKEVSGITRTASGTLWMHNDSHNPPELFSVDPYSGRTLEVKKLPVPNLDWEDLASDTKGNLYIGDFGNNYNKRKNLRIYIYRPESGALDSIKFSYPDQKAFPPEHATDWNFNMEACVFFNDSLHLFSKNVFKGNFFTKHYVLPAKPGVYVAELRDSLRINNRVITGAAISRDGKTLALTGYIIGKRLGFLPYTRASAVFFSAFQGSNFFQGKKNKVR